MSEIPVPEAPLSEAVVSEAVMLEAVALETTQSAGESAVPTMPLPQAPLVGMPLDALVQPDTRRIPHFGHVALLGALLAGGLLCTIFVVLGAVLLHLFGVAKIQDAQHSMTYAIGTMVVWYGIAFAPSAPIFSSLWRRKFSAGIQWNAAFVRRRWYVLMAIGFACFLLAVSAKSILHLPEKSPIAGLLNSPTAVWIMFAFAVSAAPLCEELIFRGFLLPAFATTWDWAAEKFTSRARLPLAENGHPRWSMPAMIAGSILASAIFALFHAGQIGGAIGPILLIFGISLVLCTVRLLTRSLAASVLTHATYNFSLFASMAIATHGFQHLHP
jgi:uncharacterized protein